jgi:hypothetical protein
MTAHERLKLDLAEVTAKLMVERWFSDSKDQTLLLKLAMAVAAAIESYVKLARPSE